MKKTKKIMLFTTCLAIIFPLQLSYAMDKPPVEPISQSASTKIDLNSADAKTLAKSVKGIGMIRAESIIKYRLSHGKFTSLNDLTQVPGLGKNFVARHLDDLNKTFVLH